MAADQQMGVDKVLPPVRGWSEATAPDLPTVADDLEAYDRQQGARDRERARSHRTEKRLDGFGDFSAQTGPLR